MTEKKEKAVRGVELKLVSELMKNSRRSDRELAKAVGVSEPTIGRLIKKLEKEGIIQEYTMIPDFAKLGYELMAITLAKMDAPPSAEIVKKNAGNILGKRTAMARNNHD
jgi:DNA-binding Lrp family transcriptional regulator